MRHGCCVLAFILAPLALHAEEASITVSKETCTYLVRHMPDADVAFKPGQDVHGKKVVPADINTSPLNQRAEDVFRIRLTNDAAKIFGLKVPETRNAAGVLPLARPEVEGFITLKRGVPFIGDIPLENEAQRQLAIICKEQQR